jgi:hypothetical protein
MKLQYLLHGILSCPVLGLTISQREKQQPLVPGRHEVQQHSLVSRVSLGFRDAESVREERFEIPIRTRVASGMYAIRTRSRAC